MMTEEGLQTLQDLIFTTASHELAARLDSWRDELAAEYPQADADRQQQIAELLSENAVDLRSVLADWALKDNVVATKRPDGTLSDEELAEEAAKNYGLLHQWGRQDLAEQAQTQVEQIASSNLARLARMALQGELNTFWGNDYAANLRDAMRKGACLVTTNPQLVNIAREEDPEYWTPVRDRLRQQHPDYDALELASAMTVQVVVANAQLLRPIWELTEGEIGYVSLQLNPKNAQDTSAMVEQAHWVWPQLTEALGGTPNCVFKVPGTKAGIDAAAELTSNAMGVNITVNYALPQQIAFAGVIEKNSTAQVSFRTQMDGRVDDPVGEELQQLGVSDWEEVKTWCTTAIRQRDYRMLCMSPPRGGVGFTKTRLLPASGRGPWNILRSIHREPEVSTFITIFPNRQEEFDSQPRELDPDGMWTPVPADILEKLLKSKLFRQSYEPDGMTVDEFDDYLPVVRTLKGFSDSFDDFVAWVAS